MNVVTIQPRYAVSDWDQVLPIMQELVDVTSAMPTTSHFDWTRTDNNALWRATFEDAEALLQELESLQGFLNQMESIEGAELERFEITGPDSELLKIKERWASLDAEYYDSGTGFQSGYFSKTEDATRGILTGALCSSHPRFQVKDWTSAQPILEEFVERTSIETGCTYFGWAHSGDRLTWHANFTDGDALQAHYINVRPLIEALNSEPVAQLIEFEVHGPSAELQKVKAPLQGLEINYFESDHRVQRSIDYFEKQALGKQA